jgi:N4-gp56 family major capsid protein
MALGTNHITTTTHANFIPEMWSDEVIAAYKSNLVLANLVTRLPHNGKKGDTVHIPNGTRGAASAKAASTEVTLITATEGVTNVSIDKHYEYSRLIEDIVAVQALDSYRAFYTDDAGFALAKQVDNDLHNQLESLQGGGASGTGAWAAAVIGSNGSTLYDQTANTNTGNGASITDAGLRKIIQTLDDVDVPLTDRVLIIPPVEKKNLMGLSRFTEQAFVGESGMANTIRSGLIGDVYGVPVFVSTNCATETAVDTSTLYRIGALMHKSALVLVEQMGVRSQTQYKQEYLADLFTADTIYGVAELRNDAGVAIAVPA